MNKKDLSERDICTKFITPAIIGAGWDIHSQIREEVFFTRGRIIVRGRLVTRGKAKFADYILYYLKELVPITGFPLAVIKTALIEGSMPTRTGLRFLIATRDDCARKGSGHGVSQ